MEKEKKTKTEEIKLELPVRVTRFKGGFEVEFPRKVTWSYEIK